MKDHLRRQPLFLGLFFLLLVSGLIFFYFYSADKPVNEKPISGDRETATRGIVPSERKTTAPEKTEVADSRGSAKKSSPRSASRPNVLFVLTDDQPTSTLRVMKNVRRWFSRQGTIFPNAFAVTPICCPSRASFLTGQYGHNSGVLNNKAASLFQKRIVVYDRQKKIRRKVQAFPWRRSIVCDLYRQGYKTALFGKYVNGWANRSRNNHRGNIPSCFGPRSWIGFDEENRGSRKSDYKDRPVSAPESDRFLTGKTISFIRSQARQRQKPWFAFLSLHSPHLPMKAPEGYEGWQYEKPYRPSLAERTLAGNSRKPPYVRQAARRYDRKHGRLSPARYARGQERMVRAVDDQFLRLLRTLRRTGQIKNTVIVFSSDNGFLWSDHGLHGKFYPYLDSVRIPFMISYPGRIPAGRIDRRLVANIDFAPTIYKLTRTRPEKHRLDGYSLLSPYRRNWLLTESGANGVTPYWAAAIHRRFHYIETAAQRHRRQTLLRRPFRVLPEGSQEIAFRELYRLRGGDGQEISNIYRRTPETRALGRSLRRKAWYPWVDRQGRQSRGCRGTVFSASKNPCP